MPSLFGGPEEDRKILFASLRRCALASWRGNALRALNGGAQAVSRRCAGFLWELAIERNKREELCFARSAKVCDDAGLGCFGKGI